MAQLECHTKGNSQEGLHKHLYVEKKCSCEQIVKLQNCTIGPTIKEHVKDAFRCTKMRKSGLVEHCVILGQVPVFDQTAVPSSQELYWKRLIEEDIFIYLEPQAVNRDSGLASENSWKPLLCLLMK